MKIAIIAPTYIPAKRANTLQVMKMAQAFVNLGHEIRLAVPTGLNTQKHEDYLWRDIAHHYGLSNEFPIDWLPAYPILRRYDYAWRAVQWSMRWELDVVYTRLPQAAAISANCGLNTIHEVHDLPQGKLGTRLFKWFLAGEGAVRLVVISQALASDIKTEFKLPDNSSFTVVLPDGVDLNRFADLTSPAEVREKLVQLIDGHLHQTNSQFSSGNFTAGYTGHLYPGRGVNIILDIAERLKEINFLIVGGETNEVDKVRESVLERGLRNVTLTGFVPNAELPVYQAACDVLLMPYQRRIEASSGGDISRYLSPMKLFEYLACGRAICSSDLPVLREILTDESALLIQPEDIQGWVSALQFLQDNPERRAEFAENAQRMSKKYSWESRAKKILEDILPPN